MKDILVSLKPYYYYLIGEGIKTNEIRKSMPKSDNWSKNGWFYMSKDNKSFAKIPKKFQEKYRKHFGKVGLKFVCDRIDEIGYSPEMHGQYVSNIENLHEVSCVDFEEMFDYIADGFGYGWHISNLVIYDKPKELGEFYSLCEKGNCYLCDWEREYDSCGCNRKKPITRPPQSWCYVEKLGV